jgi:hypothetical protein
LYHDVNYDVIISTIISLPRVGRDDAKTRQDIVLSGHFIQDEHCTFSSSTGPQGEGQHLCSPYPLHDSKIGKISININIKIPRFTTMSESDFWLLSSYIM